MPSLSTTATALALIGFLFAPFSSAAIAPHNPHHPRAQPSTGPSASAGPSAGQPSPSAGVVPTVPDASGVYNVGTKCPIQWNADTSGATNWKSMTIQFMTGQNLNMTVLETVATGIDGTDATKNTYSWTCPDVNPYSAIYFYQFLDSTGSNPTWTTRFAIASSSGQTTPPPDSTQPNGQAIPWGNGALAKGASSSASSVSSGTVSASSSSASSSSPTSAASASHSTQTSGAASSASSHSSGSSTGSSSSSSRASSNGSSGAISASASALLATSVGVVAAFVFA